MFDNLMQQTNRFMGQIQIHRTKEMILLGYTNEIKCCEKNNKGIKIKGKDKNSKKTQKSFLKKFEKSVDKRNLL